MALRAYGKHSHVDAVTWSGVLVALFALKWKGQELRLLLKHADGMAFMVERRIGKELPDVGDILIQIEPESNRWDS